jgi:hypothetical protein
MGIRFFCPKGHKLNVKEFQAGRAGICPICGVKMRIPLESTRPSSKQEQESPLGGECAVEMDAEAEQPLSPAPARSGTASVSLADPLADCGDVVWYVRPTSGGQFGPANAEVMQGWLGEGRIGADSLVWREGWRDWQTAADVFPQFSPNQPIVGELPDVGVSERVPIPFIVDNPVVAPHRFQPATSLRRGRSRDSRMVAIGVLALAVVVLVIILIVVLIRQ